MSKTKDRIRESNLRYKQSLGQNFLYDEDLLRSLVAASGVDESDDVLEIGPGAGTMTKHLLDAAHHVTSVELDERLIPLLEATFREMTNFTLRQGDIMTVPLDEVTAGMVTPFSVVANIPYYITTPLIQRLLKSKLPMKRMCLMVQQEVADKLTAEPGENAWCLLSVQSRYYCSTHIAMSVPAACFTPPPKVDSAFVVMELRDTPAVQVQDEELFFRVAAAAFAMRRKTMLNNLTSAFRLTREEGTQVLAEAGIDPMIRGEKLTLAALGAIADALGAHLGTANA